MDLINGIIMEKEDRISKLPDDIIHHILSFIDMKYAVQTSKLSRKWKHIWTSIPHLNLNSDAFDRIYKFSRFVEHAFYHRRIRPQVSTAELTFTETVNLDFVEYIVKYAYNNNVRQMTIKWSPGRVYKVPQCLFSSCTLKYLTLSDHAWGNNDIRVPDSVWDFPALETLNLGNIRLGDGSDKNLNLFSKCVNLKELTLHKCTMYGLESFTVYAPQLANLTITEFTIFPMVFNVFAPQLETPTASVITKNGTMSSKHNFLRFSTEGFSSLEKVNLYSSNGRYKKGKLVPPLLGLFHVVRSAKYLILDVDIIECLSSSLDQLSHEPCPFNNLKCLKINTARLDINDPMPTIPFQVRNYLLENSPNATFIMDLPQAYIKAMAEENRMLKEKTQIQKHVIASLKTKLRSKDQVIANHYANHYANIQMKHQIIAKQNYCMQSDVPAPPPMPRPSSSNVPPKRSRDQAPNDTMPKKMARLEAEKMLPETMAKENKMLEKRIQYRDQLIAKLKTKLQKKDNFIAKQKAYMQMKDNIIAKKNAGIEMLKSSNIHKQSSVPAPPPVRRPFSSIELHKISREQVPSDPMPNKVTNLKAENQQPETMAEKNRMLEAKIQMQYQVITDLKRKLEMKDQIIANQNVNIQMKDQVIANQNANIQMKDQVIANQNVNLQMLRSSNIHIQSDVPAPPPLPRLSSSNMATSSRHEWT